MELRELFARLHAEGLAAAEPPAGWTPPARGTPWYTRVMLGVAGWIAGMFIVGFFGGFFSLFFREGAAMVMLGVALVGGAVAIDRYAKEGEVVPQLALAVSMAGQAFYGAGFAVLLDWKNAATVAWAIVILEVAIFAAVKSALHRFLAAMVAAAALYFALERVGLAAWGAALLAVAFAALWAHEQRWRIGARHAAFAALAWGLALAVTGWPIPAHVLEESTHAPRWAETAGYAAGLLYLAWQWAGPSLGRRAVAGAGVVLLAAAAHKAPGVVAGALLLFAGFGAGRRGLAALGVAAIVGYLSTYYYQLDQTLLVKAGSLATIGAALLAARGLLAFTGRKP